MTQEPLGHMIPPPTESPPFEGELYSEAWWQRVAPQLTPDGRAVVQKTLMEAASKLEEKERERFERALLDLESPHQKQIHLLEASGLPQPQWHTALNALKELGQDDTIDLSNILICHPQTGEEIRWGWLRPVKFDKSVFVGKVDFSGKHFDGDFSIENAWLVGDANFNNTDFVREANFSTTIFFGMTYFMFAKFNGKTNFSLVCFQEDVDFQSAEFSDQAETNFESAKFAINVKFFNVKFNSKASFVETIFAGNAEFDHAVFSGLADFRWAKFMETANFTKSTWHGTKFIMEAWFFRAEFHNKTIFLDAEFAGAANFLTAEFTDMVVFAETAFKGVANFHAARFGKTVSFRGSKWEAVPDFVGTAFKDGMAVADLENLQAGLTAGMISWNTDPEPATPIFKPDPITNRLQALRKMAHDADDRPRELAYFALELQSRYPRKKKADETQKKEKGWLWPKWLLIEMYWLFSDYGCGIGRPFWWLMELLALSALGYTLLTTDAPPIALWLCSTVWVRFAGAAIDLWLFDRRQKSNPNSKSNWLFLWVACVGSWVCLLRSIPQYSNALSLSLVNALPALGVASEARKSSLEALYGCVECVPPAVHVIGVVEGVAAILLLFLIGLGLRNRFRL
jgi:hypothetical protein